MAEDRSMTGTDLLPSENLHPSFRQEDQELARELEEQPNVQIMGPPAFASPDPATAGYRLVPIEEHPGKGDLDPDFGGTIRDNLDTHHAATSQAEGAKGESDPEKMKAADWKERIDEAESQEELDNLYEQYEQSGADFKTVDEAFERKSAALAGDDNEE